MTARRPAGHAQRAVDASMSLLNEVVYRPVDVGYAEAAARPPARRSPRERRRRQAVDAVVAVALGVATVTAVAALRTPSSSVLEPRVVLGERIDERSAEADALAEEVELLRSEVAQLQADALEEANPGLIATLADAELLSGATTVQGPGLVIELDDAPDAGDDDAARVQDVDLQVVTNGLWQAGAEAIAINGKRLTALSAVRGVGPAIQVDLAPLLPPYRVEAIGDVRTLQTGFARTSAASHLALLTSTYGITTSTRAAERLELPGAGSTTLYHATVPGTDVASSSRTKEGTTP